MYSCRDEQIDQNENEYDFDLITDRPYILSSTVRAPIRPALISVPEAYSPKNQFTEPKTTATPQTTTTTATKTTIGSITTQFNELEFETTTLVPHTQLPTSSEAERYNFDNQKQKQKHLQIHTQS